MWRTAASAGFTQSIIPTNFAATGMQVRPGDNQTGMSFLDNLENSLKNLESREERDPNAAHRRSEERARTMAVAPWAAQLKNSQFTKVLLEKAAQTGYR